jgi:hypothetical protein
MRNGRPCVTRKAAVQTPSPYHRDIEIMTLNVPTLATTRQSGALATTSDGQVARPKVTRISVTRRPPAARGYVWTNPFLWVRYDAALNVFNLASQGRLINLDYGYRETREAALEEARRDVAGLIEIDTRHVAECLRRELTEHDRFSKHIAWAEEFLKSRRPVADDAAAETGTTDEVPDTEVFTVEEYRRQMQKHHPDKGGNADQFRLWVQRFEQAKAREQGA